MRPESTPKFGAELRGSPRRPGAPAANATVAALSARAAKKSLKKWLSNAWGGLTFTLCRKMQN
jgi:hypothetical protein